MFLSIIIPTFNAEKFIEECLNSCIEQDIPANDYEIICVDDGSVDRTPQIIKKYEKAYSNIVVILNEHGVVNGRNCGLEIAHGDYVWFVDNDDIIEKDALGFLKELLTKHDCDRLTFPCYVFHSSLTDEEMRLKNNRACPPNFDFENNVVWTSIIKREFIVKNDILPWSKRLGKKFAYGYDTLFIHECKLCSPSEVRFTDRPLYYYRINSSSETNNFSVEAAVNRVIGYINVAEIIKSDYDFQFSKCGCGDVQTADYLMIVMRKAMEALVTLPKPLYRQTLKKIKTQGMFPLKQPKECAYTLNECINEKNGAGKYRNFFRYYSTSRVGLFMLVLPFRLFEIKVKLSSFLRKNKITNKILDFKNKLLKR